MNWPFLFTVGLFLGQSWPATTMLLYGDSKSMSPGIGHAPMVLMQNQLRGVVSFNIGTPTGNGFLARGSTTVALMQDAVDADLALMGTPAPTYILLNLGVNDIALGLPAEGAWNADLAYILDAFHTKWPSARVYVVKPWYRAGAASCDTVAARIDAVLATRSSWAFVGHDERVWLEGGDDGATMTTDGVHYSSVGAAECARQWRTILGL